MRVAALKCPICETVIWSRARHDFRNCTCKKCFIDGGRAYTRTGWDPDIRPIMGVLDTEDGTFSPDSQDEDVFQ